MIGKFFSRALLSVVMDKSAREKYDAIKREKDGKAAPDRPPAKPATAPAEPDDGLLDVLPETLIRDAIQAAEDELERKKNMPADRRRLIEEAMAIQRGKQKLLDDLPAEQREKLTFMAMHAFGDALTTRAKKKQADPAAPGKPRKSPAAKPKKP